MSRDPQAWLQALTDASPGQKPQKCEEALKVWPAATEIWRIYVQAMPPTASNDEPSAGSLLSRCLALSVDPKMYEMYIAHIRATQSELLSEAFEYVLDTVSSDPDSGTLWKQYIDFLASQPVSNEWEEQFRRDKVRKAYKRAVTLPLANVEALWRSYGQFETRISRVSARKFIDERSAAYMKARSCYRTYAQLTTGISTSGTMPSPESAMRDAPKWRQYIAWEVSNPLELPEDELQARIKFAYHRATVCARWAPQLWFDAGTKLDPSYWSQGAGAIPESYLLAFKLAEYHENQDEYPEACSVLEKLIGTLSGLERDSTPAWAQLVRISHRMQGAVGAREVIRKCLSSVQDPSISIYLAAAAVERDNRPLADKIWSFAFSKFTATATLTAELLDFVMKYLAYMFSHADVVNARSVFERSLAQMNGPMQRRLFDHMLALETQHMRNTDDGLVSVRKLEQRYSTLFEVDEAELFAKRFGEDLVFAHDLPQLASDVATVQQAAVSVKDVFPEDSLFGMFASSLPPPHVYDGPSINVPLLMKLILESN